MRKRTVITVCLNCLKVHQTPQEYSEELVTINFCPDCQDEMKDYPTINYYRKFTPKFKGSQKPIWEK